jgi:hypothetical protein
VEIKRYLVIPVLVGYFFINGSIPVSAQEEVFAPLVDKIVKRLNSYPENSNWKYEIVTKVTEMDKQWRPKKTTITTAIIKDVDSVLSGEILKAVEIEDGITKDVTQKTAKQTEKQIGETNKERSEQKGQKRTENSYDALFPFNENKRAKFLFHILDDNVINQRPVFIIEAVAKEKDEQLFEGKYYIDQKTYDVLKAQIKPSKNPKFVKDLDMDIDFEVLPEGNYIRRRSKTRVDGGLLFKSVRMIVEEEYSDFEILDSNAM